MDLGGGTAASALGFGFIFIGAVIGVSYVVQRIQVVSPFSPAISRMTVSLCIIGKVFYRSTCSISISSRSGRQLPVSGRHQLHGDAQMRIVSGFQMAVKPTLTPLQLLSMIIGTILCIAE